MHLNKLRQFCKSTSFKINTSHTQLEKSFILIVFDTNRMQT